VNNIIEPRREPRIDAVSPGRNPNNIEFVTTIPIIGSGEKKGSLKAARNPIAKVKIKLFWAN